MTTSRWRALGVTLITLGTIAVNAAANLVPFNGRTTGEISDSFDLAIVPAGYIFLVWNVIYLGLILYMALLWHSDERRQPRAFAIAPLLMLNGIFNSAWMVLWHYGYYGWTLVVMLGVLLTLIASHRVLRRGKKEPLDARERWMARIPVSIYLGWISVATIVNVAVVLIEAQWDGWGLSDATWAGLMVIVAVILTGIMLWREKDVWFAFVIAWALFGIYTQQSYRWATPVEEGGPLLQYSLLTGLTVVIVLLVYTAVRTAKKP